MLHCGFTEWEILVTFEMRGALSRLGVWLATCLPRGAGIRPYRYAFGGGCRPATAHITNDRLRTTVEPGLRTET
jgi:hypothetical protein